MPVRSGYLSAQVIPLSVCAWPKGQLSEFVHPFTFSHHAAAGLTADPQTRHARSYLTALAPAVPFALECPAASFTSSGLCSNVIFPERPSLNILYKTAHLTLLISLAHISTYAGLQLITF